MKLSILCHRVLGALYSNTFVAGIVPTGLAIFPANGAKDVNPDTHLVLTFPNNPKAGTSGLIRIYNAEDKKLVDSIDMSIPPSRYPTGRDPGNTNGATKGAEGQAEEDGTLYQTTIVGGHKFHFFPIIVRANVATVYPHNNKLQYGKTYIVEMDPSVLQSSDGSFIGFSGNNSWTFTTKAAPPTKELIRLVVAADGSGDFNTVQGALDFVPATPSKQTTIFIKNGDYEEIVVLREKSNLIIRGESREKVRVGYPNNSFFNKQEAGDKISRRVAFTLDHCTDIQLSSFTVSNYFIGQAEAVLIEGKRIILDHMTLDGSGDAFTTKPASSTYFVDSQLTGHGDTILGYGAVFFHRSEVHSIGPISWTRTDRGNHGNIFVNSSLLGMDEPLPWSVTAANPKGQRPESVFARLTRNCKAEQIKGMNETEVRARCNFPYAEMVLINTKTSGISPRGWGDIEPNSTFEYTNLHLWEYNTMDAKGVPIDISKRNEVGKQLKMPENATTIADYSNPAFVLGWSPVVV
ncbi:pectinesterase [Tothia fuscella]|uniref:pectinesterase n=1 Tax=Tothia fuscella TaxID=1048955 RepID=A0A9P4U1I4_9PEZI|nr:pectinesterase [Tothia fuscella]